MLSVSSQMRVFLARDAVDMRKSFNGLIGLAESVLEQDPLSGHLFVFINRRRDRIKLLYWGGTGFCIWYQQLEEGGYHKLPGGFQGARLFLSLTNKRVVWCD
jgi:transposase